MKFVDGDEVGLFFGSEALLKKYLRQLRYRVKKGRRVPAETMRFIADHVQEIIDALPAPRHRVRTSAKAVDVAYYIAYQRGANGVTRGPTQENPCEGSPCGTGRGNRYN
jgi:hypothetical protein